jgi:hypothetical protein
MLACVRVLRAIEADRSLLTPHQEQRRELLTFAGLVAKPDRYDLVRMAKAFRRAKREAASSTTAPSSTPPALRVQRRAAAYTPLWLEPPKPRGRSQPSPKSRARLLRLQAAYHRVHRYYDSLCEACGEFNYAKRQQTADLTGHYALVTGARVKIGFQASLKLLRAGAHVIVTTRFPSMPPTATRGADHAEFRAPQRFMASICAIRRASSCSRGSCSNGCRGSITS